MVIRRSVLKLSRNRKFFSGPRVYQNHRPLRTMWRCRFQGKGRSNGSNTREVNADSV